MKKKKQKGSSKSGIITVYLPVELIEKVKNIVYWTPGLTIASFAEKAISGTINGLEKDSGEPFPSRSAKV